MSDRLSDEPASDGETWLDRARSASVNLLKLIDRNPHGAFPTGLPFEPWHVPPRPLRPDE